MTRLTWGAVGERFFEVGVDRGVLYLDGEPGVPWDGLVSVSESPSGGEAKPFYIDGVKYLNVPSREEFQATLEAYTYPEEFEVCDGTERIVNGLSSTQGRRQSFNLAYRSKVGNDVDGADHAYKIHLLYDALAMPSARKYGTMGESVDPFNFSWQISVRPPLIRGRRPSAHFVIDSRDTPRELMIQIEDILYGSSEADPRLPSIPELLYIFTIFSTSVFDAGSPVDPFFGTFDGGIVPAAQTSTIDGGVP